MGEHIAPGIVSIIHTPGTTSKPKGVMIRDEAVGLLVDNVMKRLPQIIRVSGQKSQGVFEQRCRRTQLDV
ncbi:hypothetical protein A6301_11980 [Pectobacterium sp. IFB5596]|nr:hypothetical protein [Pectobacterium sp. IFB5596]